MKKNTKKVQVTLSLDILKRLEQASNKMGCTKTSLIALFVGQGLSQIEIGQRAFEEMTDAITARVQQELQKEILRND